MCGAMGSVVARHIDEPGRAKQEARAESTRMCGAKPFRLAPDLIIAAGVRLPQMRLPQVVGMWEARLAAILYTCAVYDKDWQGLTLYEIC